jgi:hypothetical protein
MADIATMNVSKSGSKSIIQITTKDKGMVPL